MRNRDLTDKDLGTLAVWAGEEIRNTNPTVAAFERKIPGSLIRYSVGIEDPADLIADLRAALN